MSRRFQDAGTDLPLVQTEAEMLDQARKRLHTLSASLEQLSNKLRAYDTLPTWQTMQATNDELSGNLNRIRAVLTDPQVAKFMRAAHPYPLASFPGAQQQAMLAALTRKRFEIPVQDWADATKKIATKVYNTTSEPAILDQDALNDLWEWAPLATGDIFRKAVLSSGGQGDEDMDEDDEEQQGDAMEDVQNSDRSNSEVNLPLPSMDLTRVLPFMLTGSLPPVAPPQLAKGRTGKAT